jgi:hypothetical protein
MRRINGQPANTPEEKKAAVESAGGKFTSNHQGDFFQEDLTKPKPQSSSIKDGYNDKSGDGNKTPGTGNYTEDIDERNRSYLKIWV